MILDGHIHVSSDAKNRDRFAGRLGEAGVDGGIVLSLAPRSFGSMNADRGPAARLDNLFYWTDGSETLYPFFWIDPMDGDAVDQVAMAVERGVSGFKVICSRHEPGNPAALKVYRAIADASRPILFHSGILWDSRPSSRNNRPANFESLLEIDGLKFALAHISWPWCDECIAVYGKFANALGRRADLSVEMFIDLTPGTPPIYRRDALTKLFSVGYDLANNVIFGTDGRADDYNADWAREWIRRDNEIYDRLKLDEQTRRNVFAENLKRFVGAP